MSSDGFFDPCRRSFPWIPMVVREWPESTAQMDWIETRTSHIFKIDVPGCSKEDVKIQLEEGNVMVVKVEVPKGESVPKEAIWHIQGRRAKGDLSRQIGLPENVKADLIKAQVENGLLTIVVPKDSSPKSRSRNIPISSKL